MSGVAGIDVWDFKILFNGIMTSAGELWTGCAMVVSIRDVFSWK